MRVFYPDIQDLPLPPGHRFPGTKYRLLRERVVADDILALENLAASPPASTTELERAHTPGYVSDMLAGDIDPSAMRRIGLPWSETLMRRSRATVGGSIAAARQALRDGISGQLAGGTHHAHADFGSGFCVFNDLAVAALTLLAEGAVARIAILDLDVHQGDGNAAILAAHPDVLVVSMHGEKNFPFRKVAGDLDIPLPDLTEDRPYLRLLVDALDAVAGFRPDIVLYLSGVDPLKTDRLGRMAMTHDGLAERDQMVFQFCQRRGIPVSIAVGGGYAEPIGDSVAAYANTFRMAREVHGL